MARVFLEETNDTVAWNIFEVSSLVAIEEMVKSFYLEDAIQRLNDELTKEGFEETLVYDVSPKFVVEYCLFNASPNIVITLMFVKWLSEQTSQFKLWLVPLTLR